MSRTKHNFKKFEVWQKARQTVTQIYLLTKQFPEHERFGLTSQIRRAVVSIPSNIAEGAGRNSDKDFTKFLSYALSSSYEVETQLILSCDLGYVSKLTIKDLYKELMEVQKMLYILQEKFKE